jgi:hypothetical protein
METERTSSIEPAGVMAMACVRIRDQRQHGKPSGDRGRDQLATGERQAGPYEVTDRLAVPMKPSNAGVTERLRTISTMG